MVRKDRILALFTVTLLWTATAWSADTLKLTTESFQEVELKGPDGKLERKTLPAATVVPGTVVSYVIRYQNLGGQPADQVAITNPIPNGMEFVSATSAPAVFPPEVSVDGGKAFGELSKLSVSGKDGKPRPATAADVTQVRWRFQSTLKPGADGQVEFRARLK